MTISKFQQVIRLQFDCLVKRVVDTTVKDYNREINRRAIHETSFSDLSLKSLEQIELTDTHEFECTCFEVMGIMVKVFNESLSNALQKMNDKKVNIIIMYYFLEMPDSEIADLMGVNRSTVFRNRKNALEELRKLIGDDYYEIR